MAISYLYSLGYSNIVVPSILICRYNAKKIALYNALLRGKIDVLRGNDILNRDESIQNNLTEKFIRTFLRLKHHYNNINILSIPYELDSNLHLSITGDLISNNSLLNETSALVIENNQIKRF